MSRHEFQWTGQWEDGREVDLTKIPCASGFGVSSCMPCYHLPGVKLDLIDALELALNGRIKVSVSSRYLEQPFYNLDQKNISVDWFQ